jgi:hypothetical protein
VHDDPLVHAKILPDDNHCLSRDFCGVRLNSSFAG